MPRFHVLGTSALATLTAGVMLAAGATALAAPPTDPGTPAVFERTDLDTNLVGAAFSRSADLYGTGKQDVIATSYGTVGKTNPERPFTPDSAGTLRVYRQGATVEDWTRTTVFDESAGIYFPSQPTVTDVNGDGRTDLIQPAGWFFDSWSDEPSVHDPRDRGSITWWENVGENSWTRHDVITGQPWAYHGVEHVDLDGDGIKDLVTSGEQGRNPLTGTDDSVVTQYFKGNGDATFRAPVNLSTNGGSLPVVSDVNGDGKLDIVTAQYFGNSDSTPDSYVWLERVGDPTAGALTSANFVTHTITTAVGKAFQIKLVPNFRGDGVDRWVGTNHASSAEQAGVYELRPGPGGPAEEWNATLISSGIQSRPVAGQAAPGVFGYGDADGDGDIDLAVSGDGDHRVFWIEQKAGGGFMTHTLVDHDAEDPSKPGFGQAGGAYISDLDGDGRNELGFTSFDENTVAIWTRTGGDDPAPPAKVTVTSSLAVTGGGRVEAGARTTIKATLTAAAGGPARSVALSLTPARTGRASHAGTITLAPTGTPGRYAGSTTLVSRESGRITATYTGRQVAPLLADTAASSRTNLTTLSTVRGFSTRSVTLKKKATKKKRTLKSTVTVAPGFGRTVKLQRRSCAPSSTSCRWKTVTTKQASASNRVKLTFRPARGTTYWRVTAPATKAGTAVTSKVRKVKRR